MKRHPTILMLVFVVAAAGRGRFALAQENSAKRTEQPKTATIEGKVVRASDGVPLKKAVVSAFNGQVSAAKNASATTDADGKFLLTDLEPGRYSLMAIRTGYSRQSYGERTPLGTGTTLVLVAGQQVKDIVFRMISAGVISGKVVDEDDEPVYQARVTAQRWRYTNGKRELVPFLGGTMTNDLGEYRISQLPPGRYYISVTPMPQGMMWGIDAGTKESYAETYYPGVYDATRAAPIEVKGGDEIGNISFHLSPGHGVRISGVVKGGEKGNVGVSLRPKGRRWQFGNQKMAMAKDNGTFELAGVLPGSYIVEARTWETDNRTSATQVLEVGNSDVENVQLVLEERPDILGRMRIEGKLSDGEARIRVGLESDDGSPYSFGEAGKLDDKLAFILKGYDQGDYHVSVWGLPEDAYVKAITSGSEDVLNGTLHVWGQVKPVEIVVSTNGAHVEGVVNDAEGKPFTAARVVMVPDEAHRDRRDFYAVGNTDQYGKFSLKGVRPGTYTIYAWDRVEEGAYMDADFLMAYVDQAQTVKVAEGDRITEDLKLIAVGGE